jgi:hypothetical protein
MASAKTYDQIAWTSLGSAASSITFSSIPASWTDLRLVIVSTTSSGSRVITARLNGDTGTNYSDRYLAGDGTSATSQSFQDVTYAYIGLNKNGNSATIPSTICLDIFQYANTSVYKTLLSTAANDRNGTGEVDTVINLWRNTAAITSITIASDGAPTLSAGTTAALYGIKAA